MNKLELAFQWGYCVGSQLNKRVLCSDKSWSQYAIEFSQFKRLTCSNYDDRAKIQLQFDLGFMQARKNVLGQGIKLG